MLKSFNIITPVWNDAPEPWQLAFQDGTKKCLILSNCLFITQLPNNLTKYWNNLFNLLSTIILVIMINSLLDQPVDNLNLGHLRDYMSETRYYLEDTNMFDFKHLSQAHCVSLVIFGTNLSSIVGKND